MPDTRLTVSPALESSLLEAGLLDFEALFTRTDLEIVKALIKERQTLRARTADGTRFYIKRYTDPGPPPALPAILRVVGRDRRNTMKFSSQAAREYAVLQRLADLGVPAPTPAAYMEELDGSRVARAAVITVGLPADQSLEQVLRSGPLPRTRRVRFAVKLGRMLRDMHEGGVNHRDFYLVHILVGEGDRLYVTDLNRADIRRRVGKRWRVKDVAALLHSAPPAVTRTDKARFARAYLGGRLRSHKAFLRAVLRKAARITAHTAKRVAQGAPNYHQG
jgi:tRNA A-37 threonylcarbamoyl transferase component Bud32